MKKKLLENQEKYFIISLFEFYYYFLKIPFFKIVIDRFHPLLLRKLHFYQWRISGDEGTVVPSPKNILDPPLSYR
jgi:hypothetical protein